MRYKNFEGYLQEVHIKQNPMILDDDLPDAFADWMGEIEQDEIIELADKYAALVQKETLLRIPELHEETINKFINELTTPN